MSVENKTVGMDYINETAKKGEESLLPSKSRAQYQKAYDNFISWRNGNGVTGVTENIVLAYFQELFEKMAPTSLWAYYSMIKSVAKLTDNVDIGHFYKVTGFLKNKADGYEAVQAAVFTTGGVIYFLSNADDKQWIDVKVVCIFAICGGLRCDELTKITVHDVTKHGDLYVVEISKENKKKEPKSFTICSAALCEIVERHASLRPHSPNQDRYFLNYRSGNCTTQVIGVIKELNWTFISSLRKQLVTALGILIGHTFRRSSATFLANSGVTIERLMRHGRWSSMKIAERYVASSLQYKRETGNILADAIAPKKACTTATTSSMATSSRYRASLSSAKKACTTATTSSMATSSRYQASSSRTFVSSQVYVDNVAVENVAGNASSQAMSYRGFIEPTWNNCAARHYQRW